MKIRIAFAFIMFLVVFFACKSTQRKTAGPPAVDLGADFVMIDSASLYSFSISDTFNPSPAAAIYSRKLYLNAVDLLINKNDAKGSLPLFLRSLRIAPSPSGYLKYADALYANAEYEKARQTYFFAQRDSSLSAVATLGGARASAMLLDTNEAMHQLQEAFDYYPFDTKMINEDKAFEKLHDIEAYKIMLIKYSSTDATRKKALLTLFERNFTNEKLPYSIAVDSLGKADGPQIDYRYTDFVTGMTNGEFSRMVEFEYEYVAALNLQPLYKSFIYRTIDFVEDTIFPTHYMLLTVDTAGNKIAEQEIACACSPVSLKAVSIDTDGIIEVREIEQTWRDNPLDKGYTDNQVVKQEVKAISLFKVAGDGKIEALNQRPVKSNAPVQVSNEQK